MHFSCRSCSRRPARTTSWTVSSRYETSVAGLQEHFFFSPQLLAMPRTRAANALTDSWGCCLAECNCTVCTALCCIVTASDRILSIIKASVLRLSTAPWSNANCWRSGDMVAQSSSMSSWPLMPVARL